MLAILTLTKTVLVLAGISMTTTMQSHSSMEDCLKQARDLTTYPSGEVVVGGNRFTYTRKDPGERTTIEATCTDLRG